MKYSNKYNDTDQAELDVTSFLNLMIVLVPVLLLSMTFTQITVLEISLPELAGGTQNSGETLSQLEVVIDDEGYKVYFPENTLIKDIPKVERDGEQVYDYRMLSLVMQEVKQQEAEKTDILLLAQPEVSYQQLVFTMESVKSYKTMIAASVVEIELFPQITLDDADKS